MINDGDCCERALMTVWSFASERLSARVCCCSKAADLETVTLAACTDQACRVRSADAPRGIARTPPQSSWLEPRSTMFRSAVAAYSSLGSVMRSKAFGSPSLPGGVHQSHCSSQKTTFQFRTKRINRSPLRQALEIVSSGSDHVRLLPIPVHPLQHQIVQFGFLRCVRN
jgi:hypothetical protein